MIDLATAESDDSFTGEIRTDIENLAVTMDKLELELAFSGEYDSRNAILQIHAGAGGTESQDWARCCSGCTCAWAEKRGFKAEILDESRGEEVGIKNVTISITGVLCSLSESEHGVHRLVRLSPFDSDHARHTSICVNRGYAGSRRKRRCEDCTGRHQG